MACSFPSNGPMRPEAGNLTLVNLVKDGKLVVDKKLLQEEEYQRKYKPSDPLLRKP